MASVMQDPGHLAELDTNTHMQKKGSTTVLNLKIFLAFTFIKHRNPLQEFTQYPTKQINTQTYTTSV